jgi:hypothetical protein
MSRYSIFKTISPFRLASVTLLGVFSSCAYNDFPKFSDCSKSNLGLSVLSSQNPTLCQAIDGRVTVLASGGESPYSYSLNGSQFQPASSFSFLGPGVYVAVAQDAHNCQATVPVKLNAPGSTLTADASAVPDSECLTDNGSITVQGELGVAPYVYQFGNGNFGSQNVFPGLSSGTYVVTVKDSQECPSVVGIVVPRQSTGVSYAQDIMPILQTNCTLSGCHNGDLGGSRDWRNFDNVKTNAQNIKTRTGNKSMPAGGLSLTPQQIQLIACWVDDGANKN